jgi:hypothetical protein
MKSAESYTYGYFNGSAEEIGIETWEQHKHHVEAIQADAVADAVAEKEGEIGELKKQIEAKWDVVNA